jgi:pimeloyl-ACP methyl ester carboxylesterase
VNKPINLGGGQTIDLVSMLKVLIKSSKNGKVTIVAHSNGGLVAKALLAKLQDMKTANPKDDMIDHVDMLIMVASPQIGTASAVPGVLHGFDQEILGGWLLDDLHARELGRNMLSAYGLLPSKEYINRVSASPVVFSDNVLPSGVTTSFVKAYGNVIDSYNEYRSFLFGSEGRIQPAMDDNISPINLSPTLFGQAETLHDKIDTWTPPVGMRVIEVAGWGLDTVASFQYYPKYECTTPDTGMGKCGYVLDEKPIFTSDGDKVVVEPSAMYMNTDKVWLDLTKIKEEHKNILEVPQLENFISSLIENQNPVYDSVLTQTKPVDTSNRLRISIHSPVTIGAYDSAGNFTGKICPDTSDFCYKQEDIPNSEYLEFGEGKYINLPGDNLQKIQLQGTDVGTFTFDMQTVTPGGQTSTQSFVDIPVTTQTQANITIDQKGIPQLALDVTGDGKTDFTLTPSSTFDPVTYLQIMKITIDSLDLTQAKKNAFDNRVNNIIKSIQKGKIDKAKLKADKFETVLKNRLAKPDPKKPKLKKLSKTDAQLLLDMLNQLLDNLS